MVQFTISFVIGFDDRPKSISKFKKSKVSKLSKALRGSGSSRKSRASRKRHTLPLKKSASSLHRSNPRKQFPSVYVDHETTYYRPNRKDMKTCHFFYLLSPNLMFHVSVAAMGRVAKVCTKDETVAMRTVKIDRNTIWVAFSITHQTNNPENSLEIAKWNQHKIEFTLSDNPTDVLPRIHKHDIYFTKTPYDPRDSEDTAVEVNFQALHILQEVAGEDGESRRSRGRRSLGSSLTVEEFVRTTLQALPSPAHMDSIKEKIFNAVPIPYKSIAPTIDTTLALEEVEEVEEESSRKKKNKKKKKRNTIKKNGNIFSTITGSKLLYDKRTWVDGKMHPNRTVQLIQMWLTSTNFINEELRQELIPFGIYLKNIIHFPSLDTESLSRLKIKYSLGDLIKNIIISPLKTSGSDKIEIDDVKMYFLGDVPLLKVIENLQMNKLVIEIYGPKITEPDQDVLYTTNDLNTVATRLIHKPPRVEIRRRDKNKRGKTHKGTRTKAKSKSPDGHDLSHLRLLGYAEINCSPLAMQGFRMDIEAMITQFNSQEEIKTNDVSQRFSMFRAHENSHHEREGALENGIFLQRTTHLRVGLRMSGLPSMSSPLRNDLYQNLYKRIVVIFKKKDVIATVIQRILKLNAAILNYKYLEVPSVPYWFARKLSFDEEPYLTEEHPCLLSGFAVEFADIEILMVEGLNDYTFPEATKDLLFLPSRYGRVLYDDALIFTERLYQEFFPIGGLHISTVKIPLDDIIYNKKTFLRGNIPIPGMRALINLYKMVYCPTMQWASMQRLFPKAQDLISFDIEFGSTNRSDPQQAVYNKFLQNKV